MYHEGTTTRRTASPCKGTTGPHSESGCRCKSNTATSTKGLISSKATEPASDRNRIDNEHWVLLLFPIFSINFLGLCHHQRRQRGHKIVAQGEIQRLLLAPLFGRVHRDFVFFPRHLIIHCVTLIPVSGFGILLLFIGL